ncbi:hypothetical protein [Curtobacterium ammoniigenes]|uniref:hypothetical protein n=1 Tax=Curtobacterium ammoniigenes TaxID=395387 RepID=UPI000832FD95|nr:hypothetical protein [Curtobacterium ammoniigenes]
MDSAAAALRSRGLVVLGSVPIGTRVVVRAHDADGAVDALGTLAARDPGHVTVDTRRGLVVIALEAVIAARPVPPPPGARERGLAPRSAPNPEAFP